MSENKQNNRLKKFIPWLIFGALIIGFDALKVWPMTQEWQDLRASIESSKKDILLEKNKLKKLEEELQDIQTRFEYEAKDYAQGEEQVYPATFDAYKVSKILEIFSLQHSLLNSNSLLRINRLSTGGKTKQDLAARSQKTQIKLEVETSEETLRRLISFLQTGELPKEFINNSNLEASDMNYLMTNKLPIAHIDSLRIIKPKEEGSNIKVASLDVTFFTQK